MKKHILLLIAILTMSMSAMAESYNGIVVYANGSSTVYMLSKSPRVSYKGEYAVLYVDGKEVANVKLEGDQTLSVAYGTYSTPTGISEITESEVKVEDNVAYKTMKGMKLVIVGEDGKQYNSAGQRIK